MQRVYAFVSVCVFAFRFFFLSFYAVTPHHTAREHYRYVVTFEYVCRWIAMIDCWSHFKCKQTKSKKKHTHTLTLTHGETDRDIETQTHLSSKEWVQLLLGRQNGEQTVLFASPEKKCEPEKKGENE